MLKNKILDSLLLQDDFTSSQRLAPVSSHSSASQLKRLPTALAPTLPANRPPQVLPLAIDDNLGQPPNVLLLLHYNNNNNNNIIIIIIIINIIIIIVVERKVFESR